MQENINALVQQWEVVMASSMDPEKKAKHLAKLESWIQELSDIVDKEEVA